jgi:hypothetical protein
MKHGDGSLASEAQEPSPCFHANGRFSGIRKASFFMKGRYKGIRGLLRIMIFEIIGSMVKRNMLKKKRKKWS